MPARRPAAILAALVFAVPASAQRSNRENSPYSRYGLGDYRGGTHVALRGMGSATTAYAGPYVVNTDNPASYTNLRFTTYEGAGEGSRRTIAANGQSVSSGTATLSYLRVGIPLGKYGGAAFGVQPETRIFYHLQTDTFQTAGLGRTRSAYFGEGGTNYAFLGLAGKLKGFSLGANFGYLFGSVSTSDSLLFFDTDTASALNALFTSSTRIGGIYAKAGAQYETKLAKKYTLRLGATAALQQAVTARRERTTESLRRFVGIGTFRDTLSRLEPQRGQITLPLTYGAGVQLARDEQWSINLDYRAAQWDDFRNFGERDSVGNSYRIGFGGEYTPKPTARDYGSRITYRAGVSFGQDYLRLRGEEFSIFSATVGASLPFRRSADRIHTALEVGRRSVDESTGLARESFIRFSLGLSLIDRWFVKRRYE